MIIRRWTDDMIDLTVMTGRDLGNTRPLRRRQITRARRRAIKQALRSLLPRWGR